MARVKICGITDRESLQAAIEAGASWVGFVFYPPSPRALDPAQAAALVADAPPGPQRVGLFVEPTDAEIEAVLDHVPLDILQINADSTRVAAIRARFGRPVWHAIGIGTAWDLPAPRDPASGDVRDGKGPDGYVLDAKPPPGATRPGGNAQVFDWSMLQGWTCPRPWLLAGGLTPDNVAEAIRVSGAAAVDVSSGVERGPGAKDPGLIRAFIGQATGTPAL